MNAEFLLITRFILHCVTIFMLARYYGPDAKFKGLPSVCAGLVLASSAAMALQIIMNWEKLVHGDPQPQLVFFVFAVFLPVFVAGGNMALILQWIKFALRSDWKFW